MLWVQRLTIRNAAQDVFQLQMQRRYNYLEEANILANKIRDFPSCDGLEWVRQVETICTARIYFPYNFQSGGYARYGGKRCYDGGRQLLPPFPHFSPFCPNSTCLHQSMKWNPPPIALKRLVIFHFLAPMRWGSFEEIAFTENDERKFLTWNFKTQAVLN